MGPVSGERDVSAEWNDVDRNNMGRAPINEGQARLTANQIRLQADQINGSKLQLSCLLLRSIRCKIEDQVTLLKRKPVQRNTTGRKPTLKVSD